jgi:sugar fermentation stimulation protein A
VKTLNLRFFLIKKQDLIFLLKKEIKKVFIEVKNVTLFRDKKTAEFPDSNN